MFPVEEPAKQFCEVLGKKMAYSELGSGPPVVLLHGNPASSYHTHQMKCLALTSSLGSA